MPFALGQRWISDTETDLGLGTVVAVEGRMVTLLFPATGENRMYAKEEAPVTRVSFNVGDQIASHEDWTMTVEEVQEKDGLLIYVGVRTDMMSPLPSRKCFSTTSSSSTSRRIACSPVRSTACPALPCATRH